jgi:hypothetical protein
VVPPPPPDEVPPIEPDVRGAATIREKLDKHRALKTCAECHRKIDPLGYGLETFDPIGRWRTHYPKPKGARKALPVESSGALPSGETFAGFDAFRKALAATRKDVFTRQLIRQVLSYGTGRHMEAVDHYEIEDILATVQAADYGLRTLVVEVLASEIFRSR